MHRTVVGVAIAAVSLTTVSTASAQQGPGNGAQKAGLAATLGASPAVCQPAPSSVGSRSATGFAVLNAPGKPGSPRKVVGQVAVKDAEPGTYQVRLVSSAAPADAGCGTAAGTLVVDADRRGAAGIAAAPAKAGMYYVVLVQGITAELPVGVQRYASGEVSLR